MAVACYARAMDHVGVMAGDPVFRWLDRVILDLHFDACWFQRDRSPGRWRTGSIGVTTGHRRPLIRRGPPGTMSPASWLRSSTGSRTRDSEAHVVVRAAMAHLHVVSVHPFRDGNGRISRIVQSLVLAREGLVSPEFASIEEYLGEHTPAYYAALQGAQGGGRYRAAARRLRLDRVLRRRASRPGAGDSRSSMRQALAGRCSSSSWSGAAGRIASHRAGAEPYRRLGPDRLRKGKRRSHRRRPAPTSGDCWTGALFAA